jgi:hypothetical protein
MKMIDMKTTRQPIKEKIPLPANDFSNNRLGDSTTDWPKGVRTTPASVRVELDSTTTTLNDNDDLSITSIINSLSEDHSCLYSSLAFRNSSTALPNL